MPRIWLANSTHNSKPINSQWYCYSRVHKFTPVRDKLELTRRLVSQLPPDSWTVDEARLAWWYNFRDRGGMRLTQLGYKVFVNDLELECYNFTVPANTKFSARTVLALDRKLQMPYYIHWDKQKVKQLTFFSSTEAVLANLYGDLEKFLQNYSCPLKY